MKTNKPNMHDLIIEAENETLITGVGELRCVAMDNHSAHMYAHKKILENPEHKCNPEICKRVIEHINTHVTVWTDFMEQLKL